MVYKVPRSGSVSLYGSLLYPERPLHSIPPSIFYSFLFINLQIPFPVTPVFSHLYKTPGVACRARAVFASAACRATAVFASAGTRRLFASRFPPSIFQFPFSFQQFPASLAHFQNSRPFFSTKSSLFFQKCRGTASRTRIGTPTAHFQEVANQEVQLVSCRARPNEKSATPDSLPAPLGTTHHV